LPQRWHFISFLLFDFAKLTVAFASRRVRFISIYAKKFRRAPIAYWDDMAKAMPVATIMGYRAQVAQFSDFATGYRDSVIA
jgi:hypothetical protein